MIIGSLLLLHKNLGWITYVGALFIVVTSLLLQILIRKVATYQKDLSMAADARIGTTTEILSSIRMVKYFGWEEMASEKLIQPKRKQELHVRAKLLVLELMIKIVNAALPMLNLILVFTLYIYFFETPLTPSVAFPTITFYRTIAEASGTY